MPLFKKKSSSSCVMEYTKDEYGKEVLLKEGKAQVMMEWEKPYMEACIDALKPRGDVLEVGFGCGYSATRIQKYEPKSHTIIECNPVVLEKAKQWSKQQKNVEVVANTWQEAMSSLGTYDEIFFDDYPLESAQETKKLSESKSQGNLILKQGKKLLKKVSEKFSFMKDIKYKDEDLEFFFKEIHKRKTDPNHFLPFFSELKKREQITPSQYESMCIRLVDDGIISKELLDEFNSRETIEASDSYDFNEPQDRFFTFLEICLKNHMRVGARFSCYLEEPTSKYEDEKFMKHIICNPNLDYEEKWIDVFVPDNCKYYKGDKALVIVVTKLA